MAKKELLAACAAGKYPVIPSKGYAETLKEEVCPLLKKMRREHVFMRGGSQKLYCEYYVQPGGGKKGTVLLLHGFSESCDKYHEIIYYLLQGGFCVVLVEHRGHGRSRHDGETDIAHVPTYVRHFQDYVDDVNVIVQRLLKKYLPAPYFMYAHSMGGAIGVAYMQQHPGIFKKAVLNAPMLEINCGKMPGFAAKAIALTGCMCGKGKSFLIGNKPYSPEENFEESASNCRERYLYYFGIQKNNPGYQNGGASFRWTKEALFACSRLLKREQCRRLKLPVLLFQAAEDTYVNPGGQKRLISRIPNGRLVFVPGVKHEIYMSGDKILQMYWDVIFRFLG